MFPGEYRDAIIVEGSNGRLIVRVEQIPDDQTEDYMHALAPAAV